MPVTSYSCLVNLEVLGVKFDMSHLVHNMMYRPLYFVGEKISTSLFIYQDIIYKEQHDSFFLISLDTTNLRTILL